MRIRIGYVAIALQLPKVTSSSTLTFTRYKKLISPEEKLSELKRVTLSNLDDLYKILRYNMENNIHFYRITSRLVPLATHPEVTDWDYRKYFQADFKRIGKFVRESKMRVDTHPDQFNVINSIREDVIEKTEKDLMYHVHLFEDMNYPEGKMVLHIGSGQGGKENAINRFIENFGKMPEAIRSRLILENDDKTFTAREVLEICKAVHAPMVLDVHHHLCNDGGDQLENIIEDIFHTWDGEIVPPKLHISSPREGEKDRKHADYINPQDFFQMVELCKKTGKDFDVMLEAKQKDLAILQLVKDIKALKKEWKWVDETTIEV